MATASWPPPRIFYKRGTTYNYMLTPRMTATAETSVAYPVTIDGEEYKQQVFTVWAKPGYMTMMWPCPSPTRPACPRARRSWTWRTTRSPPLPPAHQDGYAGQFKVLYPQTAWRARAEMSNSPLCARGPVMPPCTPSARRRTRYGNLQNYICDLDNNARLDLAAVSSYADSGQPDPDATALKIVKLEEGTETPLEGAVFSVYDPEGPQGGLLLHLARTGP